MKGAEREALVEQIKPLLGQLKKFSYGKQIVAIEKLICDSETPPGASAGAANQSTTPPASHKSSPLPSRRSLTDLTCRPPVGGAAPPTPPPTDTQSCHERSTENSVDSPDTCKGMSATVTEVDLNTGSAIAVSVNGKPVTGS
jgi:mRNA-binding protein PUF3